MKIVSWNVNGLRSVMRKGVFLPFVESARPDIICLQETRANRGQVEIDLKDYEEYWCSAEKKGYSGTAIFTKILPKSVSLDFPEEIKQKYKLRDKYGDTTTEGRVLVLEFEKFFVSTVYTPNAKEDLSRIPMRLQWDPAYIEYMKLLEKKKPVIFCGDFNVAHTEEDLARPKENEGRKGFTKEERAGFDKMISAGFVDAFRIFHKGDGHYTWWSHWGKARENNVGWRIDYIMVSEKLKPYIKKADILPGVVGSDHCPVVLEIAD